MLAPFHVGIRGERVGKGPDRLLAAGLMEALRDGGPRLPGSRLVEPMLVDVGNVDRHEGEIGRSFEVMRRVSRAVADARHQGRFPLVLAGNCNASVGTYAGLGDPGLGLAWFDAHPDFTTPDEAAGGYFDGMGVAILAGQCWHRLAASVPGFRPLGLDRLLYCGIRDFEPGQREKVERHGVRAVYGSIEQAPDFAAALGEAMSGLPERMLVHLDVDCLDTSVGQANDYAAPGGLGADDLVACMERLTSLASPAGMTIASFDPDRLGSAAIATAAIAAAATVVRAIG